MGPINIYLQNLSHLFIKSLIEVGLGVVCYGHSCKVHKGCMGESDNLTYN
jgi:hypothetical protein